LKPSGENNRLKSETIIGVRRDGIDDLVIAAFEKISDAVLQSEETNRAVGTAT
jgi:hypothetical protein